MLLNKNNLRIAELASKEKSRYTLAGIHVTGQGTAVTDGHVAVRVSPPGKDANCDDKHFPAIEGVDPLANPAFILDADVAKRIANAIPKGVFIPVLSHVLVGETTRGTVTFAVTDLDNPQTFQPKNLVGEFPKLDTVWPKDGDEVFTIQASAEHLIAVLKQIVAFGGTKVTPSDHALVTLKFYGPMVAMRLQAGDKDTGQTLDAIVMPAHTPDAMPKTCSAGHSTGLPQLGPEAKTWKLTAPDGKRIRCNCGKAAIYGHTSNGGAPFFYYCAECISSAALAILQPEVTP